MSGFCAYLRLSGDRVPERVLDRMLDAARYRGPDGIGRWHDSSVALGHLSLCTTPESEHEMQPLVDGDRRYALTFDGRVDNRNELFEKLSPLEREDIVTDAALVLEAYRRWGTDCVNRLVGDFAFALWDARLGRLLCARDVMGVRPFYYVAKHGFFAAASGLAELLECSEVSRNVDEGMVGEYLSGNVRSRSDTLYADIRRLPSGHSMTVDATGVTLREYWKPEDIEESTLTKAECAERLVELLREAVRGRARTKRSFAADLSGGLDSSSIVCLLADLEREGTLPQTFKCHSFRFGGLAHDETQFAQAVIDRWKCDWSVTVLEPLPEVDWAAKAALYRDFPGYANGTMDAAFDAFLSDDMRVSIGGTGGDEWLWGAPPAARCFDYATGLQLGRLTRELRTVRSLPRAAQLLRGVVGETLRQSGIEPPRRLSKRARLPDWIDPGYARRVNLVDRLLVSPKRPEGWSWCRQLRLASGMSGSVALALELEERAAARAGVEFRHPFLDRRVVEFVLSVPDEYCRVGETNKVLLRQAMRSLLPETVRARLTKAESSHVFRDAMARDAVGEAFRNLSVGRPGWVNVVTARGAFERFQMSAPAGTMSWPLWMLYGIHAWADAEL